MFERTCSVEDCERRSEKRGWCSTHYSRWRRTGTTELPERPTVCSEDGCDGKVSAKGLCRSCYQAAYYRANRETMLAYNKQYRADNAESLQAYAEQYRDENREVIRSKKRAYYDANRDKILRKAREYRLEHPEVHQAYYAANREREIARTRAWKEANPERVHKTRVVREARNREQINAYMRGLRKRDPEKWREKDRAWRKAKREAAKAEGRCVYRWGYGCQESAMDGHLMCWEHRVKENKKLRERWHREYEESYAERGLRDCWMCGCGYTDANPRNHDHLIPRSLGGPDDSWNIAPACRKCNVARGNTCLAETVAQYHPNGIPDGPVADAIQVALERVPTITQTDQEDQS